jgi:hypothetical protein
VKSNVVNLTTNVVAVRSNAVNFTTNVVTVTRMS